MQQPSHLSEFERLMLDATAAERAGVFSSTPVDVESLAGESLVAGPARWYQQVLMGLPLAACIAMFFGIATLWQTGSGTSNGIMNGTAAVSTFNGAADLPVERCQTLDDFQSCFKGPGVLVDTECRYADFDSDGDVDLRDVGRFQSRNAID